METTKLALKKKEIKNLIRRNDIHSAFAQMDELLSELNERELERDLIVLENRYNSYQRTFQNIGAISEEERNKIILGLIDFLNSISNPIMQINREEGVQGQNKTFIRQAPKISIVPEDINSVAYRLKLWIFNSGEHVEVVEVQNNCKNLETINLFTPTIFCKGEYFRIKCKRKKQELFNQSILKEKYNFILTLKTKGGERFKYSLKGTGKKILEQQIHKL